MSISLSVFLFLFVFLANGIFAQNTQYDVTISTSVATGTTNEITIAFTSSLINISNSENTVNVGNNCPIPVPVSSSSSSSTGFPISSSSSIISSSEISSSKNPGSSSIGTLSSSNIPVSSSSSSNYGLSSSILAPSSSIYVNSQAGNLTATTNSNGTVIFTWSFSGTSFPSTAYLQYGNTSLGYNNVIVTNGYLTNYTAKNIPMYINFQAVIVIPNGVSSNVINVMLNCSGPCCMSNATTYIAPGTSIPFTEPSDGSYWVPLNPCSTTQSVGYYGGQGGPIVQTGFNYATLFTLGFYGGYVYMNYIIPQSGYYNFTYYMSEPQVNGPGQRSIQVMVNGLPVFVSLDIWSSCGGQYIACSISQQVLIVNNSMQVVIGPSFFMYGLSISYVGPYLTQNTNVVITRSTNTTTNGAFNLPLYSDGNVTCPTEYNDVYPYVFPNTSVWREQYYSLFAAKIQPRVQGNPNMRGNWSSATLGSYFTDYHQYPYLRTYPLSTFSSNQRPFVLTNIENNNNLVNIPVNSIYVDILQGNDVTGIGTFSSPLQTIQAGLFLTRSTGSKTLVLRAGTYYINQTITLTGVDQFLTITNYPGDAVILSGTTVFHPSWAAVPNRPSVYVASIPGGIKTDWNHWNEMFVQHGERCIRARYPNGNDWNIKNVKIGMRSGITWGSGYSFLAVPSYQPYPSTSITQATGGVRNTDYFNSYCMGYGGASSFFLFNQSFGPCGDFVAPWQGAATLSFSSPITPNVQSWSNPTTGYIHLMHVAGWGVDQYHISQLNLGGGVLSFDYGGYQEARGIVGGYGPNGVAIYAGNYLVDNIFEELDAQNEYFVDTINNLVYYYAVSTPPIALEAAQVITFFQIQNTSNVTIQGLTFQRTSNNFMNPHIAPGGGDWAMTVDGAINLINTSNVVIQHNVFTELGGNGVVVYLSNNNSLIYNNEFISISESGVAVIGYSPSGNATQSWSQPRQTNIFSNLFLNMGVQQKQAGAITTTISYQTRIIGNMFKHGPRSLVNFQDGFGGNHEFAWNLCIDSMGSTDDGGCVNTWNRDAYYHISTITGLPTWETDISNWHHNIATVDNFAIYSAFENDDGSTALNEYSNIMFNGESHNNMGTYINYTNNFYVGGNTAVFAPNGNAQTIRTGNLYLITGNALSYGCQLNQPYADAGIASNNIYYNIAGGTIYCSSYTLAQYQQGVTSPNEINSLFFTLTPMWRYWDRDYINLTCNTCSCPSSYPSSPVYSSSSGMSSSYSAASSSYSSSASSSLSSSYSSSLLSIYSSSSVGSSSTVQLITNLASSPLSNGSLLLTWTLVNPSNTIPFNITYSSPSTGVAYSIPVPSSTLTNYMLTNTVINQAVMIQVANVTINVPAISTLCTYSSSGCCLPNNTYGSPIGSYGTTTNLSLAVGSPTPIILSDNSIWEGSNCISSNSPAFYSTASNTYTGYLAPLYYSQYVPGSGGFQITVNLAAGLYYFLLGSSDNGANGYNVRYFNSITVNNIQYWGSFYPYLLAGSTPYIPENVTFVVPITTSPTTIIISAGYSMVSTFQVTPLLHSSSSSVVSQTGILLPGGSKTTLVTIISVIVNSDASLTVIWDNIISSSFSPVYLYLNTSSSNYYVDNFTVSIPVSSSSNTSIHTQSLVLGVTYSLYLASSSSGVITLLSQTVTVVPYCYGLCCITSVQTNFTNNNYPLQICSTVPISTFQSTIYPQGAGNLIFALNLYPGTYSVSFGFVEINSADRNLYVAFDTTILQSGIDPYALAGDQDGVTVWVNSMITVNTTSQSLFTVGGDYPTISFLGLTKLS